MNLRTSVDFMDGDRIGVADRGFMYGDGFFETLRIVHGGIPLLPRHAHRMHDACARLRIPLPDTGAIFREAIRLAAGWDDAVARVTLTVGAGPRGYARAREAKQTIVVSAGPLALDAVAYRSGLAVRLCETRLGDQPLLAGIKHLNRLEQVLARSEWDDPRWQEGLMSDLRGDLVCATAANLFAVYDGELVTPPVDRCGVAGVARAEILATQPVSVSPMNAERLAEADEVFLTSAVRGILPVRAFAARTWQPGPVTRAMQAHWRDIGLPLP